MERSLVVGFVLGTLALAGGPDGGRVPDPRSAERQQMVDRYIAGEGIRDPATLQAMRSQPGSRCNAMTSGSRGRRPFCWPARTGRLGRRRYGRSGSPISRISQPLPNAH